MKTVKIEDVLREDRQRTKIDPKPLDELKRSIASSKGLLHPPVIAFDKEGRPNLVAGERRLEAMRQLHEAGLPFSHDGQPVPLWEMPYTSVAELSEDDLAEAELEENLIRVNLSWQDETRALSKIHELRKKQNPEQTISATAREITEKSEKPVAFHSERRAIAQSEIVAPYLNDPEVQRARSREEAHRIVLDRVENQIKGRNVIEAMQTKAASNHQLILGDCLEELKRLPAGQIDTIITDPPYGIKADKMGKGEFHMYDDSPDAALEVCRAVIREGFRLTKPKAILFMFCDVDHFVTLRTYAAQQAWTPWRAPIVWHKGTDGHAPWGKAGFVRTYECILFAVKGGKELVYPGGPDVHYCKRPGRAERVHAAEKPVGLLEHLLHLSTLPGQTVLDPTAGSGPIISAGIRKSCKVIAIEKDKNAYDHCLQRLAADYDDSDEEPESTVDTKSALYD
jgi:DNA modification methylase